jgi:hypothetical protein
MKQYLLIIVGITLLASCQKVVTLNLKNEGAQIVIEGEINNQPPPYTIKVSKSVSFYDDNAFNGVSGATVIVSDNNTVVDTLKMITPGIYQTLNIWGTPGHTYNLKVVNEGVTYTAQSIMPFEVTFDSIKLLPQPGFGGQKPTFQLIPVYSDPSNSTNYYRFTIYKNGEQVQNTFIDSDEFSNGKTNDIPLFTNEDFKPGDLIQLNMLCIEYNVYQYYFSLQQNTSSAGGGPNSAAATPANPVSNISNKALGYFSANTKDTKIITIR